MSRAVVRYTVPDRREFEFVFPDRKAECRDLFEARKLVADLKRDGYRNVQIDEVAP